MAIAVLKIISNPNKTSYRILYSILGSSIETWKLECNIEIGGQTKRDQSNKKSKRLQLQREIVEVRMFYFTEKMNER